MIKLVIGVAIPIRYWWSFVRLGYVSIPIPLSPFTKFGLKRKGLLSFILTILSQRTDLTFITWGGRAYDLLAEYGNRVLYFEDGFYRSPGHWKKITVPDFVSYEHSAPYFVTDEDSRLKKAIKATLSIQTVYLDKLAQIHIREIRNGRCKYGAASRDINTVEKLGAPKKIYALQSDGDFQIILSRNYATNYALYESIVSNAEENSLRGHPNSSRNLEPPNLLKRKGVNNIVLFNSTLGFEALINGISVTYYGDSPIKWFFNEDVFFPVTILPSERLSYEICASLYEIYPIKFK